MISRIFSIPRDITYSFTKNRELVWELVKRDFVGRYKGSFMGLAWSFFHPLLMLFVYSFVFGMIFNAKWGVKAEGASFSAVLFSGMIVHGLMAECVNRAPNLITGSPNYVKKIVFPLEIIALVVTLSAFMHFAIGAALLLAFHALTGGVINFGALLVPIIILPLIFLSLGLTWIFSALGVYLRDVGQVMAVATSALMFLSPVFYPSSAIPEPYRFLIHLNPLTNPIEQLRAVLLFGGSLDWGAWTESILLALSLTCLGFFFFQKLRKGFADVL